MKASRRYNAEAIVLRSYKLKEADRIVVLMTKEFGKIRGVASGVRKTRNRFGSRLESFNHLQVQLHIGRGDLDFLVEASAINQFPNIRKSFDRQTSAFSLLEAVDLLCFIDKKPNQQLFEMLLGALRELERQDSPILVPAFFLKLLALEGFQPILNQCAVCAEVKPLVRFDFSEGGMCCAKCGQGPRVSTEAHLIMQEIIGGNLSLALRREQSKAVSEVSSLATLAFEYCLERKLKTRVNVSSSE